MKVKLREIGPKRNKQHHKINECGNEKARIQA